MYKVTFALTLLMAWGCQSNPSLPGGSESQSDQHEEEASQYTLFSQNAEFYFELEPMKVGEALEFLVHVSHLESYKPYTSGKLSIRIDGASTAPAEPREPGIFLVPFIPKNPGEFGMEITLQTIDQVERVDMPVHIYANHDDLLAPGIEDHAPDEKGEVSYLKEQAWKSDFMVSPVTRGPIHEVILTSGELIPAPGKINRVGANIGGIVTFANKNLVQGTQVSKGQHLFTISGKSLPENNFELRYLQASNDLLKSRSEYERHKILYEGGAVSERQFLDSRTRYFSDSLRYYSLAESTSEQGLKIFAPASGSIHDLEVKEGEFVETGQNMVTISSDQILLLRADLPQQFHQQAGKIKGANFRTAYSAETWSIADFNGRHLSTGRSVAENDHYLPVYFELENDGRLLEGAFAEIFLLSSEEMDRIIIPESALLEEQGGYSVYVQVSGESYTKRAVSTGQSDGRIVEILDGLSPGERIVTRGVILLKAASMVTGVAGHGHSH